MRDAAFRSDPGTACRGTASVILRCPSCQRDVEWHHDFGCNHCTRPVPNGTPGARMMAWQVSTRAGFYA